ncbi:MAG: PDZ domain-containing protein [Planctomycetota bacterium]|nr:PDZ domain-containing protein [Planctomycetota bacterium]
MKACVLPVFAIVLATFPAWSQEPAPQAEAPPKTETERLLELEKRIQDLERSMVEKDARILDLQRRLEQPPAPEQGPLPGFTFRMSPEEMQQFQQRLHEHFRRNLEDLFDPRRPMDMLDEDDDEFFNLPRLNGGFDDWGRPRMAPRERPRLGVQVQTASPDLAARYRNEAESGAFVIEVTLGSAAEKAGLKEGDCVTAFDKSPIRTADDLIRIVQEAPEGRHDLKVVRRGESIDVAVSLEPARPAEAPAPRRNARDERFRERGGWLERNENAQRDLREMVEVKASQLELNDKLAGELKLTGEQRKKMDDVLLKRRQKLNDEYAMLNQGGGDRPRFGFNADARLRELAEKHAKAAEEDLAGVLTDEQAKAWREWRARHQELSVSRHLQMEERGGSADRDLGF